MEMRKMVVCRFFRNKQGGIKATRVILIEEKRGEVESNARTSILCVYTTATHNMLCYISIFIPVSPAISLCNS